MHVEDLLLADRGNGVIEIIVAVGNLYIPQSQGSALRAEGPLKHTKVLAVQSVILVIIIPHFAIELVMRKTQDSRRLCHNLGSQTLTNRRK